MTRFTTALLALAVAAPALAAQQTGESGAYIIMLGRDTISVERFARTANGINHEQVLRSPQTMLRHTHMGLTPANDLTEIFVMVHQIDKMDAPLIASTHLTASGDSAGVISKRGDSTMVQTRVAVRKDMIPYVTNAFLPYELATMRWRAQKGDSTEVTFVNALGDAMPVGVKRLSADSVRLTNPYYTFLAKVDDKGRILSLDAVPGTPFQASLRRVASVDINGVASAWKAKEGAGAAMGQLSPGDSVRATVGGATLAIDYSRPSMRGRKVFGGMVPYGEVWRTGANAATRFTTSQAITIGGTAIPAGTYTLWTVPTASGATLIVSKRTTAENGQPLWGTEYKNDMDLARIPMKVSTLSAPAEQFGITVEPQGAGALLRMRWDTREMSVPIAPAK